MLFLTELEYFRSNYTFEITLSKTEYFTDNPTIYNFFYAIVFLFCFINTSFYSKNINLFLRSTLNNFLFALYILLSQQFDYDNYKCFNKLFN